MLLGVALHEPRLPLPPTEVIRAWDIGLRFAWYDVETAPGVYDRTGLDALVALGKRIVFVFYGTPAFYTTSTTPDPYGRAGGMGRPTYSQGYPALAAFARWVHANYGQHIALYEVWNEPTGFYEPCLGGSPDWTAMVELYDTVNQAIGADALVSAPSMLAGNPEHWEGYLAASVVPPKVFTLHAYDHGRTKMRALLEQARRMVHPSTRLAVTEWGVQPRYAVPRQQSAFLSLTPEGQRDEILATVDVGHEFDLVTLIWYDWDGYEAELRDELYPMGDKPQLGYGMRRAIEANQGLIAMGTRTGRSVVDRAWIKANDEQPLKRWSESEALMWLNDYQLAVVNALPMAYHVSAVVTAQPGTRQTLAALGLSRGLHVVDVPHNVTPDGAPGDAITETSRAHLDDFLPTWHASLGDAADHWMRDPGDPTAFYLAPALSGGGRIRVNYSAAPPELSTLDQPMSIADVYANGAQFYLLFSFYSKDLESIKSAQLAQMYQGLWLQELGIRESKVNLTTAAIKAASKGA